MKLLGVDTGGTFTDFVWFDGERLGIHKVLSTPQAPEHAILQGILIPSVFLGGGMLLDIAAAQGAVGRLDRKMELSVQQAAEGISELANEHMAQALRVISVQRGIDPAAYTLTAFGGAGGSHVCALAAGWTASRHRSGCLFIDRL